MARRAPARRCHRRRARVRAGAWSGAVVRLGPARAGLDVDEAVVRIEPVGEHAPELHVGDDPHETRHIGLDGGERGVVAFGAREREQLLRIAQPELEGGQAADDGLKLLLLFAELLGALWIVPDLRVFERRGDCAEAGLSRLEVKDTSAALRSDR